MGSRQTPGLLLAAMLAFFQLGCVATVAYSAPVAPTRLVVVSPGVWVVYDYPEAIFYTDDAYWWWNGGTWYRSRYADDGWVVVRVVPAPLRQVRRPQGYVHYRVGAQTRPVPRQHVRRTYVAVQPAPQRGHDNGRGRGRAAPAPRDDGRGRGRAAPPPARDDGRGRGRTAPPPARDDGRAPPPRVEPRDDGRGRGRGPSEQPGDRGRGRGQDEHDGDRGRGRGQR